MLVPGPRPADTPGARQFGTCTAETDQVITLTLTLTLTDQASPCHETSPPPSPSCYTIPPYLATYPYLPYLLTSPHAVTSPHTLTLQHPLHLTTHPYLATPPYQCNWPNDGICDAPSDCLCDYADCAGRGTPPLVKG